ncbi:MAG: hypothetical protein NTY65_05065 [Planctomycetota bacterium]|nr:hypothetical protein [Planctomycetota bacterium]
MSIRRIHIILLVAAMLHQSIGGGLVVVRPPEDRAAAPSDDEQFPCKGHGCGCASADACRTHCCCAGPALAPQPVGTDAAYSAVVDRPPRNSQPGISWQSPSCAGLSMLVSSESAPWLLQFDRFVFRPERAGRCVPGDIVVPEDPLLPLAPPPPRAC